MVGLLRRVDGSSHGPTQLPSWCCFETSKPCPVTVHGECSTSPPLLSPCLREDKQSFLRFSSSPAGRDVHGALKGRCEGGRSEKWWLSPDMVPLVSTGACTVGEAHVGVNFIHFIPAWFPCLATLPACLSPFLPSHARCPHLRAGRPVCEGVAPACRGPEERAGG